MLERYDVALIFTYLQELTPLHSNECVIIIVPATQASLSLKVDANFSVLTTVCSSVTGIFVLLKNLKIKFSEDFYPMRKFLS